MHFYTDAVKTAAPFVRFALQILLRVVGSAMYIKPSYYNHI